MPCRRRGGRDANAQGSGRREGPRPTDGDARNSTRTDNRAASATLRLHRTEWSSVWRTDRHVVSDAVASTTGALTALLSRLEEPGAHVGRKHLAIPRGMSIGGRLKDDPH
jgi:hypothetical protein